jgi:hypothetical protein
VIAGGIFNALGTACEGSSIGGGAYNVIFPNSHYSRIAGGSHNVIADLCGESSIGGGGNNLIGPDADYATIPGGRQNAIGAGVDYAFAAGRRAKANHSGAFVWADSSDSDFASTANDQFLIRASGGVGIGKNNPATALDVSGTVRATAFLGNGSGLTGLPDGHSLDASDGSPANQVYVNSSGLVGVGTTTPGADLHVHGNTSTGSVLLTPDTFGGQSELVLAENPDASFAMILRYAGGDTSNPLQILSRTSDVESLPLINIQRDSGNVGIGTGSASVDSRLHVQADNARPVKIDRHDSDGELVAWARDDMKIGDITVASGTVSYNAFTGSHYAWCDEDLVPGTLMTLTGNNRSLHAEGAGEVVYGVEPSSRANDPACLGAYAGDSGSGEQGDAPVVKLVAAVGNGELWAVDTGRDIQPGDLLISAGVRGCVMLDDPGRFPVGHVIARAAQAVHWADESAETGDIRRKRISVLFEPFTRGSGHLSHQALRERLARNEEEIAELNRQLQEMKQLLARFTAGDAEPSVSGPTPSLAAMRR